MSASSASRRTKADNGEHRFVIYDIGWEGYQGLLKVIGDRLPRVTYTQRDVELMKPRFLHERYRAVLGQVVSTITEELDLSVMTIGATTLNWEDQTWPWEFDDVPTPDKHQKGLSQTEHRIRCGPAPEPGHRDLDHRVRT